MEFTPRLMQILYILLNAPRSVTAAELAQHLQINKRTVFRELDHVDQQLAKYGLVLKRKSGVGYILEGSREDKERLLSELEVSDDFDPRNREKRQQKLIQALIETDEQQKAFYYANQLQVSEATISKDLESVEKWFRMQEIGLQRQGGIGIWLDYREKDFRNAMLVYMLKYETRVFAPESVRIRIEETAQKEGKEILGRFVRASEENFILYATVTVMRIQKERHIISDVREEQVSRWEYWDFVGRFTKCLEEAFGIVFHPGDQFALYIFLQGCKVQYVQNDAECIYMGDRVLDVRNVVYRMTNTFDPVIAYELKEDEEFVKGLVSHLAPAITRILHHMETPNPILAEVKTVYPDIYERTARAAKVMEQEIGIKIPDDEIGFMSLHFGGAMMRNERMKRQRHVVDVGVVCASGIGISTLLSSKLRHHFEDRIRVRVLSSRMLADADVDFLISTFPVESELETVRVSPMLDKEEFQKIGNLIEKYAFQEKKGFVEKRGNENIYEAMLITNEINSIVKSFSFQQLDKDITFDRSMQEISAIFGEDEKRTAQIYRDFTEREALSTQIIEEFEIVFLHARTSAVSQSKFMVVLPEEGHFRDAYFKGSRAIIVMLIPADDPRRTLAISAVSEEIFEDEEFLEQIKTGQKELVYERIRRILENYLNEYLINTYSERQEERYVTGIDSGQNTVCRRSR